MKRGSDLFIRKKNNTTNNKMFLAVFISGSYEFCSDGKGSLYTLHAEYFKRHGSSHMRCVNRQACFDKEVGKSILKKKYFEENYESFSEERL